MKITLRSMLLILTAGVFLFSPIVSAAVIQGVVESINDINNSLRISRIDSETGRRERLNIMIPDNAKFEGVKSLDQVQVGTEVQLQVEPTAAGILEAKRLEKIL